jgi:hypothetical protein
LLCYTPRAWNRIKLTAVLPRGRLKDLLQLSCIFIQPNNKTNCCFKVPTQAKLELFYLRPMFVLRVTLATFCDSKALPECGCCTSLSSAPRTSVRSPHLCAHLVFLHYNLSVTNTCGYYSSFFVFSYCVIRVQYECRRGHFCCGICLKM